MKLRRLLLVMFGGMIGTAVRLAAGMLIPDAGGLPLAIITVNLSGALLIGVLAARLHRSSDLRIFLGAGVLGGFTTYSAFAIGAVELWEGAPLIAALYAALTLVLGVALAALGLRLGSKRPAV